MFFRFAGLRQLVLLFWLVVFAASAQAANMPVCTSPNVLNWDSTNGYTCNSPTAPSSTVASLPICNSASKGLIYLVTDALLPSALSVVVGGGAVTVSVICNGSNFIVQ